MVDILAIEGVFGIGDCAIVLNAIFYSLNQYVVQGASSESNKYIVMLYKGAM